MARNEGEAAAPPDTSRVFVMLFEMTEYLPEVGEAMDYFFDRMLEPADELILITPVKTYSLKPDILSQTSRAKTKDDFLSKVRADVTISGSENRNLIRTLTEILGGDEELDVKLQAYADTLKQIEHLRAIEQKSLIDFAKFLKNRPGQKHVFFFYQKEIVPRVNHKEMQNLINIHQERPDSIFEMADKFESYHRDPAFDAKEVKKAFADSSIAVHFLYLTRTIPSGIDVYQGATSYLALEEQSQDIYSAFSEISTATGGLADTSSSAEKSFKSVAAAAESYYLLYYRPKQYLVDGKFHEIVVRVKSGSFKVSHRFGYYAE